MRDPWVMYRTVLLHIPYHVLKRGPEPGRYGGGPLQGPKDRLVELLTPREMDQCTSILWGVELGSRRPTKLMEVILACLPPGELAGKLLKTVFLHHLPGDLKDLVAFQLQQLEARELA